MEGSLLLHTRLPLRSPFATESAMRAFAEHTQLQVGELLIVKTETLYCIYKVASVTSSTTTEVIAGVNTDTTIYNTVFESVIQTSIKNNPNYFRYIGSFDSYAELQSSEIQAILTKKDIFYLIDEHNGETINTAVIVDENGHYNEIKIDLEPSDLEGPANLAWVEYKTQTTRRIKPIIALRPYTRNGGFALDATSYYNTYNEAESYARNSGAAYPGQIIAVDDATKRKVSIYKIVYADSDSVYRYRLAEIASGSGGSGSYNQYKGIVDGYEGLSELLMKHLNPNDTYVLSVNDLVYVKTSNGAVPYIYTGSSEEEKAWEKVTLGIDLATEEQDGFITSDIYRTWITDEEGIFYSPGTGEAEDNKFIKLNVTGVTDSREIMSADKVKETILSMINTDSRAVLDVVFSRDMTQLVHGDYIDNVTMTINYIPNGSGMINKCTISSSYSGNMTLYASNFAYDEEIDGYKATCILPAFIADASNNNILEFKVKYDYNEVTMQEGGEFIKRYDMAAFKQMGFEYGKITGTLDTSAGNSVVYVLRPTNNKDTNLIKVKTGETYTVEAPANANISYVTFFTPYPITQAEFYERHDTEFLETLEYKACTDDTRFAHCYTMRAYPSYPINSKMTFKITF